MKAFWAFILIVFCAAIYSITYLRERKIKTEIPILQHKELKMTGKEFVDSLDRLNYFEFTSKEMLDVLKNEIEATYNQHQVLTTTYESDYSDVPNCKRLYNCDAESLFEGDGVFEFLKDVKPTFKKLGIQFVVGEDSISKEGNLHTIVVNGKLYKAYEGDPNDPRAWGIAHINFLEILNDQLSLNKSHQRVYPILFNNDARIIFLTHDQYRFVASCLDKIERPMEPELWWETFGK